MKMNPRSVKKTRLQLLHQYYSYTGFYKFLGISLKKALPPILLFIAGLLIVNYFVININDVLIYVTENYSDYVVFSVFFASESLLGLIPPEIFIAWSDKTTSPILYLSILALLSYLGGVISYFIGKSITKIPSVHQYLEVKMAKHIKNTRKWGGFLIVVGALLPIPFSITSIAAGMIKYPFISYLLFGLLRFVRFYLYAVAIFSLV
ncbi:short-chain dehydrogenase [Aquimarina sp. BL5]|uniref:YqaA family protein n=1 Tax=Aquimarina sp. BL5 TaxID=1714860 RepID=UPI000E50DE00|nr:VTT domain-containing protein [Aquimarina sp. BL5]AXT49585.1 short-chain dehydrogenase [Aquimarina sp. BL5]RKN03137.1 short-chain dehydrogenase [Aquimarina sp. BL5]